MQQYKIRKLICMPVPVYKICIFTNFFLPDANQNSCSALLCIILFSKSFDHPQSLQVSVLFLHREVIEGMQIS